MYINFLFKIVLTINICLAIYLLTILISFDPYDQSWLYSTSKKTINNIGGYNGSFLASICFFTLGRISYIFPLIIIDISLFIFYKYKTQKYINYFLISVKLVGFILIIVTTCSLLYLFKIKDIWFFPSGGILGIAIIEHIKKYIILSNNIIILIVCFLWVLGFFLYIGNSFSKLFKLINFLLKIIKK